LLLSAVVVVAVLMFVLPFSPFAPSPGTPNPPTTSTTRARKRDAAPPSPPVAPNEQAFWDFVDQVHDASDSEWLAQTIRETAVARPIKSRAHSTVAASIKSVFAALDGWRVDTDSFQASTPNGDVRFTNIIATFAATPPITQHQRQRHEHYPIVAAERLVVAAHYDSKIFAEFDFAAATDSAVPVALLLDLARTLQPWLLEAQKTGRLKHSLQLIFFDGEEAFVEWTDTDSVYGSRHLSQLWANISLDAADVKAPAKSLQPKKPSAKRVPDDGLANISLFWLLDLIGAPSPTIYNYYLDVPASNAAFRSMTVLEKRLTTRRLLHYPLDEAARPLSTDDDPQPPSPPYFNTAQLQRRMFIDDDHRHFLERNVPIFHAIPVPYPAVWHQYTDDVAHLDWTVTHDFALLSKIWVAQYLSLDKL
jgi:glutaminyl-peptide cyclotransferase